MMAGVPVSFLGDPTVSHNSLVASGIGRVPKALMYGPTNSYKFWNGHRLLLLYYC